jgi:hypothetical protein
MIAEQPGIAKNCPCHSRKQERDEWQRGINRCGGNGHRAHLEHRQHAIARGEFVDERERDQPDRQRGKRHQPLFGIQLTDHQAGRENHGEQARDARPGRSPPDPGSRPRAAALHHTAGCRRQGEVFNHANGLAPSSPARATTTARSDNGARRSARIPVARSPARKCSVARPTSCCA